jgi:hypothetical protein
VAVDLSELKLNLPEELLNELREVALRMGIGDVAEAAMIALGDWISRRKAEFDDRDPHSKYFVNEGLDELAEKKKK